MIRGGIKTKAQIKATHDEMVRFLIELCRYSDGHTAGRRSERGQAHYERAQRLIRRAGRTYEPSK